MTSNSGYPKKNRLDEELPVLRIEIQHADGVEVTDPNGQIFQILQRPEMLLAWKPVPGRVSVISGRPAILYRSEDFEAPLTLDEYVGLVGRELEPNEYLALLRHFGSAFDWHEDFADPDTGKALQPKGLRSLFRDEAAARDIDLQSTWGETISIPTPASRTRH